MMLDSLSVKMLLYCLLLITAATRTTNAFAPTSHFNHVLGKTVTTQLHATVPDQTQQGNIDARRKILFNRRGPHFLLNRGTARIEFGDTVLLANEFPEANADMIDDWLRDPNVFGQALWQSDKLSRQGDGIFRMGLLTLEFVMLKFQPWVEVRCKTVPNSKGFPIFTLQSIGYDPNPTKITFVPGMPSTLTLDDVVKNLQIQVEVVGQVGRMGETSLRGTMVYQVTATLPPALLLFPDPLLKAAAETINREVVQFARKAFQKGSKEQYPIYVKSRSNETSK